MWQWFQAWLYKGPKERHEGHTTLQASGRPLGKGPYTEGQGGGPGEAEAAGEAMLGLKTLPLLLLLHLQLSKAFPIPPESQEEENIKTVQVN